MKIWINGEVMAAEEATISPFDHGYLYGLGVFETFRTYNGHAFLIGDHLDRLHASLNEMGIRYHIKNEEVAQMIEKLQTANGGEDGYFRLNVSAGVRDIGLYPDPYESPTVILLQKALPPQTTKGKEGRWLKLSRNTPETDIRLKSHHYFNNLAGRREITDGTVVEGLFLTKEGYVAEGVTSNLFWIKNQTLYTPSIETGILPGVTRQFILAITEKAGLRIEEGLYLKEAVLKAEEVFITNSIQEIVPIHSIDHLHFQGTEGKWTNHLKAIYSQKTSTLIRSADYVTMKEQ
ncbi:aminodeoxychorismate lyase [Jeotgalibacillus soli]|uniref:4-amino-4-deoxychorismate lyase n=1 Tax=Jeotgalibacillus soli TaxID=889306 RepID=A0A0C2W945_9BACL|nr:aminodeoxychorismate lyase [Jeotgalibacillus soli]KIL52538.1 4-amino-4-deoxychorismate lyase [Jeotgalibacillus soli]